MDNNLENTTEANKDSSPDMPTPTAVPTTGTMPEPEKAPTSTFDFSQDNLIAAASYIGPLVVIPFLTKKDDPFTKFHIKQGLILLIVYLILYVFSGFMYFLWPIISLINLGLFVLSIIGIVNTLQCKEKELPLLGQFASHIKI